MHFIPMNGVCMYVIMKLVITVVTQLESVGTTIRLEQSMTDRRRSEFTPIE